jgi:hypothetical protein
MLFQSMILNLCEIIHVQKEVFLPFFESILFIKKLLGNQ